MVSCHTADSKPVKQEVNGTVILPPLVFPALRKLLDLREVTESWESSSTLGGCRVQSGAIDLGMQLEL